MEEGFQIFISLPTDDVCTLKGLSEDTRIYQLKSRVELKTGIPGDVQHLYFMNKELFDNYKLDEVKLKAGCIVRVKLDSTWINLFEACWRGDIYEVFQNGVQYLDEKQFQGYNIPLWNRIVVQRATNALFIASHRGFLGLIMELLNQGAADINGKTRFGRTCLHVAAYQGFVGCVSLLLSEGALCNQIDYNGKTALALASENGHIYCERRLWLYQMSLKALGGLSRNSSENCRSRTESGDSLEGRPYSRSSGKPLRLNANKMLLEEAEEKRDYKKVNFHLPRVQTSDDQNSPSYKPVPEEKKQSSPSPFPLVQIAEKYRKEYKKSKSTSLPNMGGSANNSRPRTAPVSTQPRKTKQESGAKNELDIVEEANAVDNDNSSDDKTNDETINTQAVVNNAEEKTEPIKTDAQATLSAESTLITEKDKTKKERPQTSRPYARRHLDLVISSAREQTTEEEKTTNDTVSRDFPCPPDEPASYNDFDVTEHAYRPRRPAQTFDTWLEKKRNKGQLRPAPAHAPEKSKLGKTIDPEAFKDWLNKKRRNHYRSNSESSSTSPRKTYISSGMTFEKWLEEKKKMANKESENQVMDSHDTGRRARVVLAGKTYEDWLNEKMKQVQSTTKSEEEENKKDGPKSGKSFQMWLLEKQNQKQIEIIHKATEEKEKQRQLELEQYQKYINPNYRTFEEWLAIKKQEHLLERERTAENELKQNEPSSEEKKKDADLVFGIWLTMKFVEEMKGEEEKYHEMKEKWERKEKQRAALRRAIHINRLMKKQQHRGDVNEQNCNGLSLSWS